MCDAQTDRLCAKGSAQSVCTWRLIRPNPFCLKMQKQIIISNRCNELMRWDGRARPTIPPTQSLLGPLLPCNNIGPYSWGVLNRRFQLLNASCMTSIRIGRFYDIVLGIFTILTFRFFVFPFFYCICKFGVERIDIFFQ